MNRPRHSRNSPQAGYSLAEMLTVVAIIGTLALVFVPNFMSYYQSNKVKSAMRTFTTDVRKMRALAISRGVQTKLSFDTGAGKRTYRLYYGNSAFGTTQTWTALNGALGTGTKTLESVIYFPDHTSATPQTFKNEEATGTDLDVIFFPDGRVRIPLDPSGTKQSTATITLMTDLKGVPKPSYKIDISPIGRVMAK
jgi:prepilin-type N-terminal cleavage/methylation domain-containing protein